MKGTTQADTEFFRGMLSEADGQTTLLSDDDPSLQDYDGKYADYAVPFSQIQPEAAAALPALLNEGGFTADGLFLSAYAYLLRLLSGQKEVLFFIASQNQGADAADALPVFYRSMKL